MKTLLILIKSVIALAMNLAMFYGLSLFVNHLFLPDRGKMAFERALESIGLETLGGQVPLTVLTVFAFIAAFAASAIFPWRYLIFRNR